MAGDEACFVSQVVLSQTEIGRANAEEASIATIVAAFYLGCALRLAGPKTEGRLGRTIIKSDQLKVGGKKGGEGAHAPAPRFSSRTLNRN